LTKIVLFIGFLELGVLKDGTGEAEVPCDFDYNFINFGCDSLDEKIKRKKHGI